MAQNNLKEIQQIRLDKIDSLRSNSIEPFAYKYNVKNSIADIKAENKKILNKKVSIAGRIISLRKMGKSSFVNIQDMHDNIQIYIKDTNLNDKLYDNIVRKCDLGDIVGIEGIVFFTKTDELSIKATNISMLSKNIRPLPNMKEKDGKTFFSFDDKEHRYRKRYLDLIINRKNKNIFIQRSAIINELRNFLNSKNFIEVETPVLQPLYGGANAKPFITHHNTLDQKLYLRIADELYLKRLIIGGFDKVYEISKNFRNEGMDKNHNPEFTMLEFYSAYNDIYDMIDITQSLIRHAANKICSNNSNEIDFNNKFQIISFFKSLDQYSNNHISKMNHNELFDLLNKNDIKIDKNISYGKLLDKAFSYYVEPHLIEPTFVIDYPKVLSPLAKELRTDDTSSLVERFELFINGMEIANSFSELNDPVEQRNRLNEQVKQREHGDDEAQVLDEDFLEAMETGMPPTGGVGIGIDRLVMILTNQESIKDVILFPAMKNEIPQEK